MHQGDESEIDATAQCAKQTMGYDLRDLLRPTVENTLNEGIEKGQEISARDRITFSSVPDSRHFIPCLWPLTRPVASWPKCPCRREPMVQNGQCDVAL